MMEHYTTQATEVNRLWLQHLRELALKQARAMDLSRPQAPDLGKTLHGMWQHLTLQGWELIFTPPPHQKNYSGAEAQQNPANEARGINTLNKGMERSFGDENPSKESSEKEHLESRAASVEVAENNQEIWAPCSSSSEKKRSGEAHEKQETDAHSAAGTRDYKASEDSRCGMEITPEAPILKTELPRDDRVLPEKEFPSSGREAKTEPEARAFIERNEEREHTLDDNRYNESWTYQAEAPTFIAQNEKSEHSFIGQNLPPEAPSFKTFYQRQEHFFEGKDAFQFSIRKHFMSLPILDLRSRRTLFFYFDTLKFFHGFRLAYPRTNPHKTYSKLNTLPSKKVNLKSKSLRLRILKNRKTCPLKKLLSFAKKNSIFRRKLALNKEGGSQKPAFLFG